MTSFSLSLKYNQNYAAQVTRVLWLNKTTCDLNYSFLSQLSAKLPSGCSSVCNNSLSEHREQGCFGFGHCFGPCLKTIFNHHLLLLLVFRYRRWWNLGAFLWTVANSNSAGLLVFTPCSAGHKFLYRSFLLHSVFTLYTLDVIDYSHW